MEGCIGRRRWGKKVSEKEKKCFWPGSLVFRGGDWTGRLPHLPPQREAHETDGLTGAEQQIADWWPTMTFLGGGDEIGN